MFIRKFVPPKERMLKEKLGVDERDAVILSMFAKNPEVSQTDLAEALKLSQPSINARVQKLKKKGLLSLTAGIEFNKTDMYMARVDFTAPNSEEILSQLQNCSFFVNGFIMSGSNNVSVFIVGHDLQRIENIISMHLRSNPDIKDINMSVVVSSAKPFIYSVDIEKEENSDCENCDKCKNKKE